MKLLAGGSLRRFEPSHFREFGSVDLIGKAPGSNPVVRKFLM